MESIRRETGTATASPDGRLARSQRTRRAIVEALRSLHQEGDLRPTAPRVAERAGVSLRTVWQHFDDLETLFAEAGRVDLEIARSLVDWIDPDAPLSRRLKEFVGQRTRMFETMAPVWRAARLQEPFSAQIQRNHEALTDWADEQLDVVFRTELRSRPGRAEVRVQPSFRHALHAATNWTTWEFLRTDLHLDVADAQQALELLLNRLLTNDAAPDPEDDA